MADRNDVVAIVGAGKGGAAILQTLLGIPGISIRYVFDADATAPGIQLAKKHKIACRTDGRYDELSTDPEIDLIFEVTGRTEVFDTLRALKHANSTLLVASGAKIIFHLLDAQQKTKDRLEKLKRGLEAMVIERTEEIEEANQNLQNKILEYERLNQELLRINNEKTRYLLQATHQLKAPFAAIQSYVDIILDGYTGEIADQTRDIMQKIKLRCELLSGNIKEMLELAHLKSCKRDTMELKLENLKSIVGEAVERTSVIAEKRGIAIRVTPCESEDLIRGHRGQILTLFMVLLENAIHYSHDGSAIALSCAPQPDRKIAISVRDHGIGIPEAALPRIFDEYFRTNEAVEKHQNGSGLGLAIVKEIAHLHNFHIDVASHPGEGTTFTIIAPIERRSKERA